MSSKPTPEFRAEAVRIALTSGLPRKQMAADFGIGFSTLSRWIQQDRRNPEKPTVQSDLEREVAELRKESRSRHPGEPLVRNYGRRPARLPRLVFPPGLSKTTIGHGMAGPHPRTVPLVSRQLRQAPHDRRTEGTWL